jgi:hypothetical protein
MLIETWLLVVLVVLATARLTRLITADRITGAARKWVDERYGEDDLRSYFITCDFCVSTYIAPIVAGATILWPDNRVLVGGLIALTASYVTGMLTRLDA